MIPLAASSRLAHGVRCRVCAIRSLQPTVIDARERQVRRLQADLAAILAAAALERGLVAVEVASLDRHDVLFRYNADRLVMPASNMKIRDARRRG